MKTIKRVVMAIATLSAVASMPGAAHATGYIRIGDKCYIQIGVLVQIPCPKEVSENP